MFKIGYLVRSTHPFEDDDEDEYSWELQKEHPGRYGYEVKRIVYAEVEDDD